MAQRPLIDRKKIEHPHRPDMADYEFDSIQQRIELSGGEFGVVGILLQYAMAAPKQGSYAGSLWAIAEWLDERLQHKAPKWRSLKDDPPGDEHNTFFVGHSRGGRMDLVFRWPDPKTGHLAFWKQGQDGNYPLTDYKPDVWYPGPPNIAGSWQDRISRGKSRGKLGSY